jgi:hypothetical protein
LVRRLWHRARSIMLTYFFPRKGSEIDHG